MKKKKCNCIIGTSYPNELITTRSEYKKFGVLHVFRWFKYCPECGKEIKHEDMSNLR